MALNDPSPPSGVIRPRLRFLANGQWVPVALTASVTQNNAFHASRFTVTFAPPMEAGFPAQGTGSLAWWSQQSSMLADVQLGLIPDGGLEQDVVWTSLLQGEVDRITTDPIAWTVQVEGRDLTRRFIDNKTELAHVNQTSSQIVASLAAKEGLGALVTPTSTPVGRYYQLEHDHISLDQFHRAMTEWDLIVMLARFEGFDAFVDGNTLYFQPPAQPFNDAWVARWQIDEVGRQSSNLLSLRVERALTIAKGVQVTVKSWHGKQARAFVRKAGTGGASAQQYILVRPNMTEDQAQQLANQVYADLSRHERVLTGQAWGDTILTTRVPLRLTGTGTDWDRVYYPVEVTRHIDQQGFVMDFRAQLLPPSAESVAQ